VEDFVEGVGEEGEPVLDLVEGFGEEDEVGAIGSGGLDVHPSQLDVLGINAFGLCMEGRLLPRM
jgi:hypothetical protein